jgi:hypothetical protein
MPTLQSFQKNKKRKTNACLFTASNTGTKISIPLYHKTYKMIWEILLQKIKQYTAPWLQCTLNNVK